MAENNSGGYIQSSRDEAAMFESNPSALALNECITIRKCCLETLRLTAHSIGGVRKVCQEIKLTEDKMVNVGDTLAEIETEGDSLLGSLFD